MPDECFLFINKKKYVHRACPMTIFFLQKKKYGHQTKIKKLVWSVIYFEKKLEKGREITWSIIFEQTVSKIVQCITKVKLVKRFGAVFSTSFWIK